MKRSELRDIIEDLFSNYLPKVKARDRLNFTDAFMTEMDMTEFSDVLENDDPEEGVPLEDDF